MWKFLIIFITGLILVLLPARPIAPSDSGERMPLWNVQSVDTMKYSRDIARLDEAKSLSYDSVIEKQISQIASIGATHVAIGTPYDEEFLPYMQRWVAAARRHNLLVWYRGNWSGWEGWFEYPPVSRAQHLEKTRNFILTHPELFMDGDIFTACPECENGGPGNPLVTGDDSGFREFIIDQCRITGDAFSQINKKVASNYQSMNGDLAHKIMDTETTTQMGGIVSIDHYVATPDKLLSDIRSLAAKSGGQIVLGELGVPVPDIHGTMTPSQQAAWLKRALAGLAEIPQVIAVNYWVNVGGSTALWHFGGETRPVVSELKRYFSMPVYNGILENHSGVPLSGVRIVYLNREFRSDTDGRFRLPVAPEQNRSFVFAQGYPDWEINLQSPTENGLTVIPDREKKKVSLWTQLLLFLSRSILRK